MVTWHSAKHDILRKHGHDAISNDLVIVSNEHLRLFQKSYLPLISHPRLLVRKWNNRTAVTTPLSTSKVSKLKNYSKRYYLLVKAKHSGCWDGTFASSLNITRADNTWYSTPQDALLKVDNFCYASEFTASGDVFIQKFPGFFNMSQVLAFTNGCYCIFFNMSLKAGSFCYKT